MHCMLTQNANEPPLVHSVLAKMKLSFGISVKKKEPGNPAIPRNECKVKHPTVLLESTLFQRLRLQLRPYKIDSDSDSGLDIYFDSDSDYDSNQFLRMLHRPPCLRIAYVFVCCNSGKL